MTISVVIPTFRRLPDLCRGLEALKQQICPPDEVVIVVRATDQETLDCLKHFKQDHLSFRIVQVEVPGQVAALNAGVAATTREIIAITDDDTMPCPDWLLKIEAHFVLDKTVGGVGGRDRVHHGDLIEEGACSTVGIVQWFGRVIGNHHIGDGGPRSVDILKGANMSYRRSAIEDIQFDLRLLGSGAQVHNDMAFSLAVKRAGWKLIYDPAVIVEHFPAQRFDNDQRGRFDWAAQHNAVYNEVITLLNHLPRRRWFIYVCYALTLGTREAPGLLQIPRLFMRREKDLWLRVSATLSGRINGLKVKLSTRDSKQTNDCPKKGCLESH